MNSVQGGSGASRNPLNPVGAMRFAIALYALIYLFLRVIKHLFRHQGEIKT
jgi:hypothetical protein